MLRVTADTNILVSGLVYRRGNSYYLLRMALDGTINLTVSHYILDEMADVLARKFYASHSLWSERSRMRGAKRKPSRWQRAKR